MPYFKTSQEWLEQSALLIEARPETTKVTTKYAIKAVPPRKPKTDDQGNPDDASSTAAAATPPAPRGSLVLKTYDPVSGVTLKYRTTKAAEVSRLVYAALGRLGRSMAALPDVPEVPMTDAPAVGDDGAAAAAAPAPAAGATTREAAASPAPAQQGAGGGGKKKKKGKR